MADEIAKSNKNKKLFIWAASLTLFFALIEIVYGVVSGSLMMVGDGVHMISDSFSLFLSLIATIMATKAATERKTFGYKRFEPIAAFINGLTLMIIPVFIMIEAINRLIHPVDIIANQMFVVGALGLAINALVGLILTKANANLNVKSALLHVLADLLTSASVVIAALGIKYLGIAWLDPIGSIVTSAVIIAGGVKITKESFHILMEGAPQGYSADAIEKLVKDVESNLTVKDVKVWCINESEIFTLIRVNASSENERNLARKIRDQINASIHIPSKNIYVNINS